MLANAVKHRHFAPAEPSKHHGPMNPGKSTPLPPWFHLHLFVIYWLRWHPDELGCLLRLDASRFSDKNPFDRKVDKVLGERAVYRQSKGADWGDTFLFYESQESRWKRGTEAKLGQPSLNVSRTGRDSL